ncbi:tetraacyldisaccharide 4'-kinase [Pontibacter sp. 13R65]|uniref:tetraacyldisaccharide 4'-kinase n=1 Tax=Pontibacter sp. 13R65 TaxID=3127458 RepID=UPI00301C2BF1
MVKKLKQLLLPFSFLYGRIMAVRNSLYDQQVLHAQEFELPVIAVGNLTVGGTGKTPHVEYLLRLLRSYRVATLSRGYKRSTKGFVLADGQASAATIGDEPFQYYQDFKRVTVAVCEDRVVGIKQLLEQGPKPEVILLDDAMQHRPVKPSLNLLITDFTRPFYHDYVMPTGLLREPRIGAKRADAVLVSKCPAHLSLEAQEQIRLLIRKYTHEQTPIFFTGYRYGEAISIGNSTALKKEIILLTGIANAAPLVAFLKDQGYTIRQHLAFPDHHHYTRQEVERMQEILQQPINRGSSLLTTRKDAVKLTSPELSVLTKAMPLFYLPIEVEFLNEKEAFDKLVVQHVQSRLK